MKLDTPMMAQIDSVADLMRQMLREYPPVLQNNLTRENTSTWRKLILTGCGDSLFAAMAARQVLMRWTGLDAQVIPAVELARNEEGGFLAAEGTVVVAVSNSGHVSRIIEAVRRINALGGTTLAVTGNENSALYHDAKIGLLYQCPSFPFAPGVRSYCACLLALYLLAFRVGKIRGKELTAAEETLLEVPPLLEGAMESWKAAAFEAARRLQPMASFEFVGSGSDLATGWFGHAKIIETVGKPTAVVNVEDWFHLNYFMRDVYRTATCVVFGRNNPARSRYMEMLSTAETMGRPVLLLTDDEMLSCGITMRIPQTVDPLCFPLACYLPLAMVASFLCDLAGETYNRGGVANWTACNDCATIFQSEQILYGAKGEPLQ